MDIIKNPVKKPLYQRYWYVVAGMACIVLFIIFSRKYQNVTSIALKDELLIDTVARGELSVSVRAYGRLSSKDVYRVGAESDGRVESLFVKAGATVEKGNVLVQLSNAQLLQQLNDAQLEYEAQVADLSAADISGEAQLMDLRSQIANAEIDYQIAKMELDAKRELLAKGPGTISRVELERAELTLRQYQQRWDMEQARIAKTEESIAAQRKARQARLRITRNTLEKTRQLVEGLTVTATVAGIVQEMALDLGQLVRQGENITRIAEQDALVAEIQIPELQVQDIQLGMKATVDTRSDFIDGRVSRIDPRVVDGSVLVEIELLGDLPAGVRPDLNVEATIEIDHIEDTIYVKRPVFARAFSQSFTYRINTDGDIAERIPVRYGQASTNFIEVLEGVEAGDQLIISDPTALGDNDRILLR